VVTASRKQLLQNWL